MNKLLVWGAALFVCAASAANAQFHYRLTGSVTPIPLSAGSPTINVGTLTSGTTKVVQIFDSNTLGCSGLPITDLPNLTITGTASGGKLVIFIADGDTTTPFVSPGVLRDPSTAYDRGLINMPEICFGSCGSPNTALRDASILVAWVGSSSTTGDATHPVDVGQVWALDVPGDISGDMAPS